VAVKVAPEFIGWKACLKTKTDDRYALNWSWFRTKTERVDATGRIEFLGVAPGRYYVCLSKERDLRYARPYRGLLGELRAGPVEAKPLKSCTDVGSLPAEEIQVPEANGTFGFTFKPSLPPTGNPRRYLATFYFSLTGTSADFRCTSSYPVDFTEAGAGLPLVIGNPPKHIQFYGPGECGATGVPAGEYKFRVDAIRTGHPPAGMKLPVNYECPDGLTAYTATVTVKLGENVNLGELKYAVPEPILRAKETGEDDALLPEDLAEDEQQD
jgi:hypothetical protein